MELSTDDFVHHKTEWKRIMQLQRVPVGTIVTTRIAEKAVCDEQGLTTVTAAILVELVAADAVFVDDGEYTVYARTKQGMTLVNTGAILKRCTYAFDDKAISNDQRKLIVHYKLKACRYPYREGFTESLVEAVARLGQRIEDVYTASIS